MAITTQVKCERLSEGENDLTNFYQILCVVVVDISVCLVTNDYRGHVRNDGDSNYTQCPGQSCSRLHLRCQSEGTNRVHQSTSSTMKSVKSSIFYYQVPSYLLDEHNENAKNFR